MTQQNPIANGILLALSGCATMAVLGMLTVGGCYFLAVDAGREAAERTEAAAQEAVGDDFRERLEKAFDEGLQSGS